MNTNDVVNRLEQITQQYMSERNKSGNFRFLVVTTIADLDQLQLPPPAMAYVKSVGDFYFRHGPEFWFGKTGTQDKAWNDRESDKWIRAPYAGKRAIIQSTHISKLSHAAYNAIFAMILMGPKSFTGSAYGAGYWTAIEQAFIEYLNTTFIELNTGTCETEGSKLYDIEEGDITVEAENLIGARFVQERSKLLNDTPTYHKYPFELLGTKSMILGTPGIHLHHTQARTNFMDIHPERMCYIVTAKDHSKGERIIQASVYPSSVPKPTLGSNPRQWIETRTKLHEKWPYYPGQWPDPNWPTPQEWDKTAFNITAPTSTTPGDWYINHFCFLNIPQTLGRQNLISLKIESITYNNPSMTFPDGALITVELEQEYPSPVLSALSTITFDEQPYWDAVAPVRRGFSFEPITSFGGYINSKTITGYIKPFSTTGRAGDTWPCAIAGQSLDLFDPVNENWGHMKGHSPLRGISKNERVKMPEHDNMYRVTLTNKNRLENPSSIGLNMTTHALVRPLTNIYGEDLGGLLDYYPEITVDPGNPNYRNAMELLVYCPWTPPIDDIAGVPIIIESIKNGRITLMAPLPCNIPANTRLNVYASADTDLTLYAYYDYYEFIHRLAAYNKVTYDITTAKIAQKLAELQAFAVKVNYFKSQAELIAMSIWMSPPYYVLKELRDCLWDSSFTNFGNTYPEVQATLVNRATKLGALLATQLPPIQCVELMSILDYGKS